MARRKVLKAWRAAIAIVCLLVSRVKVEAQTLKELIAGAKKKSEIRVKILLAFPLRMAIDGP